MSKYHWTTFNHDHRTTHLEGLTIDLTQTFHFSLDKTIDSEGTSINNTYICAGPLLSPSLDYSYSSKSATNSVFFQHLTHLQTGYQQPLNRFFFPCLLNWTSTLSIKKRRMSHICSSWVFFSLSSDISLTSRLSSRSTS